MLNRITKLFPYYRFFRKFCLNSAIEATELIHIKKNNPIFDSISHKSAKGWFWKLFPHQQPPSPLMYPWSTDEQKHLIGIFIYPPLDGPRPIMLGETNNT